MNEGNLTRLREVPGLRGFGVLIALQLLLAVWATWRLAETPRVGFEVSSELVVTSVEGAEGAQGSLPQVGDQVVAVEGRGVDTLTELWLALGEHEAHADLILRRYNVLLNPRALGVEDFEQGWPSGLQEGDRPVKLSCSQNQPPVELPHIDLEGLRDLVAERGGGQKVLVHFERPQYELSQRVTIERGPIPFWLAALLGLGAALMVVIVTQVRRSRELYAASSRGRYLAFMILLASLACIGLMSGRQLRSDPLLFAAAVVGLALFKPVNLEMHLRGRSGWSELGQPTRVAIFVAPVIFLVQLIFFSTRLLRVGAEADLQPTTAQQMENLWLLLLLVYGMMVAIDAALLLLRHQRRDDEPQGSATTGARVGLALSGLAMMAAVYQFARDATPQQLGLTVSVAVFAQLLGDMLGVLELPRAHWVGSGAQALLSQQPVSAWLRRAQALLPDGEVWQVTVLDPVDGPADGAQAPEGVLRRQGPVAVRAALRVDEEGREVLVHQLAPQVWVDLLDVLATEGGMVPRPSERGDDPERDPVSGMARRLGLDCIWPLRMGEASGFARAYLVLSAPLDGLERPPLELAALPLDALEALGAAFEDLALSAVMQAGIEAGRWQRLRDGGDAAPGGSAPVSEAAASGEGVARTSAPDLSDDLLALSPDLLDVPLQLRARLRAMEAELRRLHPTDALEPTAAQHDAAEALAAGCPALAALLGEAGVGKALVARRAHAREAALREATAGPFVRLHAAELPDAVLPLELFGDAKTPGLVEAARGGTLLIEGADRLTDALFDRLLSVIGEMTQPPWLLLGVEELPPKPADADPDSDEEADAADADPGSDEAADARDPAAADDEAPRGPARDRALRRLGEHIMRHVTQVIEIPPLRAQPEAIAPLASYFLHRAAMRHGRVITSLSDETLAALERHRWPGNLQEMREVLERGVLVCRGPQIATRDLFASPGVPADDRTSVRANPPGQPHDLLARHDALVAERDALVAERDALADARDRLRRDLDAREPSPRLDPDAQRQIEQLCAERDALQARADALRETVTLHARFEARCQSLEGQLTVLAEERDQLRARLDASSQTHDALQAQLSAATSERASLLARLEILEGERDALQIRLDALDAERSSLLSRAAQLDDARARQADLERLRAQLERRVETLDLERQSLSRDLIRARQAHPGDAPASLDEIFSATYEEVECRLLAHALARADGDKSQAARTLGLKRGTFIHKLNKYDLG